MVQQAGTVKDIIIAEPHTAYLLTDEAVCIERKKFIHHKYRLFFRATNSLPRKIVMCCIIFVAAI